MYVVCRLQTPRRNQTMARCVEYHNIFFFLFLFSKIITTSATVVAAAEPTTAYEVLQQHGFPVGLLPQGITGYEVDSRTGEFSARLNSTCGFELQESSYRIQYEPTIQGVITHEKIKGLKGVSVKVLVMWLNVVEVVRDGKELQFSVGVGSKGFPVENFVECPRCGCGLDCKEDHGSLEINGSSYASSSSSSS